MKFGLIGAGGIGKVRAKALANTPGCELFAVTDADPDRARALAASGRPADQMAVAGDYNQMLAMDEIEALIVSTPPQFHEETVIAALESGKHVLCEKPLANTLDACRRMVEASRRTGKTLATGFNHRYFPAVQFVKQTLDSGAIGELDHVRAFAGHTGLDQFSAPWMYDQQVIGGGALMDNGIHIIDLTRYILGDVVEVYGFATSNVWKQGLSEDNGCAILRGANGKYAMLQATWTEDHAGREADWLAINDREGIQAGVRGFHSPLRWPPGSDRRRIPWLSRGGDRERGLSQRQRAAAGETGAAVLNHGFMLF